MQVLGCCLLNLSLKEKAAKPSKPEQFEVDVRCQEVDNCSSTNHEGSVGGVQSGCICGGIIVCADIRVHDLDLCNVGRSNVGTAALGCHIQQLVQASVVGIVLASTAGQAPLTGLPGHLCHVKADMNALISTNGSTRRCAF